MAYQTDHRDGSDLNYMAVHTVGREDSDAFIAEILNKRSHLDQNREESKVVDSPIHIYVDEGNASPASNNSLNYVSLANHVRSCLMYCSIFTKGGGLCKGRLVRLLVAEGLIQQRQGEIMEFIADELIEKLIHLGMLQERVVHQKTHIIVSSQYQNQCLQHKTRENFVTSFASSSNIRLAIHNEERINPPNLTNLPIGSVFVDETESLSKDYLRNLFHGLKFLRVLQVDNVSVEILPDEVGNLVHLRYLSLKNTCLQELPESISNLSNLQTLDIRGNAMLTLPSGVLILLNLRHLKMSSDNENSVEIPTGIGKLANLQTFSGFHYRISIASELSSLTQMRELAVDISEAENESEIFASIMKMKGLQSLSLSVEINSLELFSPPPLLRKLKLTGRLVELPNWLGLMENLTKLDLFDSQLSENPTSVLQLLPNLKHLKLFWAYNVKQLGMEFCRAGGFPKLEALTFSSASLIEWTEIEYGALPSLKYLSLPQCYYLRCLPEGLQYIITLKHLALNFSHPDLTRRLRLGGQDRYKIEHIPQVEITWVPTKSLQLHPRA